MDKVIVITGASAGIGAALAELASSKGAKVVLAARRKAELEKVAARCSSDALVVVMDATVRADHERLRDEAMKRFGRIDVWVNNAGRGITKRASELTDEDLDVMMRDNVKSALYGMQAVLPHFQQRNAGQIINVSSGLGRMVSAPFRSAYAAAKHALNALTAAMRMDLRNTHPGIAVTLFMPGIVATEFGNNALGGGPDSRALPGAQPVEEVAQVMVEVIEKPRAEVYSRPEMKAEVERYYQDIEGVEAAMAARFKR